MHTNNRRKLILLFCLLCLLCCGCNSVPKKKAHDNMLLIISINNLQTALNINAMQESHTRLMESLESKEEMTITELQEMMDEHEKFLLGEIQKMRKEKL